MFEMEKSTEKCPQPKHKRRKMLENTVNIKLM